MGPRGLSTLVVALCALACGEKKGSVESTPSDPDLVSDASAHNGVSDNSELATETGETNQTDVATPPRTSDAATDETEAPSLPVTSDSAALDAAVAPSASVPMQAEPSPTDTADPGLSDAGQTPPSASSPEVPLPTNELDASAATTTPDVDAGMVVPNVPTDFPLLPVECSDIPSMTEEGRCITQRSCDTLRQYSAACDGTMGDLYCTCINDGYPSRLQFSEGTVEQACAVSLQWCDPARGLSLATRTCEPPTEYTNDDYCWHESECGYEWDVEGALAIASQKRTEGASCSFNVDTQKWECDCALEGVAWVKYSFPADASSASVCVDAYGVCENFPSMVPEIGAECSAGDNLFSEQSCRTEFECQYPANVGGRRVSVTAQISVSCRLAAAELVCYLGAQRDGTKVASLSPNTNEACVAFSADEIVGLASLPKPATE